MNKNYINFRTDMADERVDEYKRINNLTDIEGIKVTTNKKEQISTTIVEVLNENGVKALSKEIGKYVTMDIKDIKYLDEKSKDNISSELSKQIKLLMGESFKNKQKSVFVVGLGNIYVTPDSLGPKVIQNIEITRHLIHFAKDLVEPNTREISAISPGVLGTTGIETSEIILSVSKAIKPDFVIVVDSLASTSIERLGTTIQLSNTGITPGAGVKNKREGINKDILNVPVIAIGVPTVVDMATITSETLGRILEKTIEKNEDAKKEKNISQIMDPEKRYNIILQTLNTENLIVTPKEIDDVIKIVSEIIADGINMSVN